MKLRCGKGRKLARVLTLQRVLLAVHWTADAGGLVCWASNAGLATAAGRSAPTTLSALRELHSLGLVAVVHGPTLGAAHRAVVLMDHADAASAVAALRRFGARARDVEHAGR